MDKSWMTIKDRMSPEYRDGVKKFVDFAMENTGSEDVIRCPCMKCMNTEHHINIVVAFHLVQNGIAPSYKTWVHHGEPVLGNQENVSNENCRDKRKSVGDYTIEDEREDEDDLPNLLHEYYMATIMNDDELNEVPNSIEREDVQKFDKLLKDAHRELYPGCKFTLLSFVIKLLHVKVLNKWSNKSFDALLGLLKELLPISDGEIPGSIYEAKKFLRELGLGYVPIDACKYDCALFWKENEKLENCPVCGEPRYKLNDGKGKKIPHKILRYFPLTPRLQRLYMSKKTCTYMRWHKEKRVDDGVLRHPADGEAWKDFDRQYPEFAQEARNVRLGLATDGFNPFGNMSTSYSMWPVVVVPYNLPPWKCMKEPFTMMSLLIPGPLAPGRDIDVYLRPLIDELKDLWAAGAVTYDASTEKTFRMHAAVMWTINDFPAYGNLSGWTTKGYLACPSCNEHASSQKLRSKIGYTGARRWLPEDHPWRRSRLFDGKSDHRPRPSEMTGEQIFQQICKGIYKPFGKHPTNKRKREEPVLNWSKMSIFFELPYWEKLKLRHNLDVMHIEKNICDALLGILLSIEGKNKDTEKARLDLEDMKIRKALHLLRRADGSLEKPPALYTLSPEERHGFYEFLKSIKYPDGYAANISRCVSTKGDKLSGLKSHDCHVLLQRILPIGMRGYLAKDICTTLFELGNFFQELCSKTLRVKDLEKLQERIVLILCKMEKIFPPAFFDVMVHLAIHLPREAMLGGPVQYRWMYPIERFLGILKGYVTNRAYPEGSISEAYIVKECLTFCSMYLGGMETVFNRAERNVDGGGRGTGLEVFKQNVRPFGLRTRASSVRQAEIDMAHWFVLSNSVEIQQYLEQHENQLKNEGISDIAKRQQVEFPKWFKEHINQLRAEGSLEATDELWSIANGPRVNVNIYSGCISNGVRFHTKDRDSRRKSQNSGVVVEGDREGETIDFYGNLCRVWELNYMLEHQVVLFQCEWYKTGSSKQFCSDPHCISINVRSRWYKNDPFVLPSQVKQVFYVNDTKLGDNWKVVERIQHRGIWDIPEMDDLEATAAPNDAFQQDESTDFAPMVVEDAVDVPLTRNDIDPEIIPSGVVLESQNEHYEDITDDEEEESMGEFSEDEENELPWESDSDIDPDIEP